MKNRLIPTLASIIALSATVGCSVLPSSSTSSGKAGHTGFNLAEMQKLIEANNERFTAAHVRGDQVTIDGMFTLDAKCLPPGADPAIGRDAIAKLTREYLETGVSEFREETTDFYGNEDLLIDQGTYVMVYGQDKTRETGKYLNVWKKESGVWKIYSNIWNANAPTGPAK
ncbi:MAG: nuclear transport factor 2 family protein [Opitutae bacterium]|nr:nuclear transport factor 2 family protein [Opitutae bacterium]